MRKPPSLISWLLKRFLNPDLLNGIYGDLLEEYNTRLSSQATWKANFHFLLSGMGFIRFPTLLHFPNSKNQQPMNLWKNYLKFSLRSISRNKVNTAVSITGLVVSFIASIAILQYVQFEKSYDDFHGTAERLFRATNRMTTSSGTTLNAATFYGAKEDFLNEIPEIVNSAQIFVSNSALLEKEEQSILEEDVLFVTPEFFDLFNFPMVAGGMEPSPNPNSIYLSKRVAEKLFPEGDYLNKTLEVSGVLGQVWTATISGVFENLPVNTHVRADVIFPLNKLINVATEAQFFGPNLPFEQVRWRWLSFHTYLMLDDEAEPTQVELKANQLVDQYRSELDARLNQNHDVILQPLTTIHTTAGIETELSPVNNLSIINLFMIVAICILVIGWINYINLNTAKSVSRGKEVGIRKVLGSGTLQLKIQFQLEALFTNIISLILAFALLWPIAPLLEGISGVEFFSSFFQNTNLILVLIGSVLLGSFLSGLYPSQVLSNYKSIDVLKGRLKNSSKGVSLRRMLVGVQFVFTLFLMSGLMVVHNQMSYMIGHDLGIDITKTIVIETPAGLFGTDGFTGKMTSLKNEMSQLAGVNSVSIGSLMPGVVNNWRNSTEGTDSDKAGIFIHRTTVDHDYFDLYGVELLAGRLFDRSYGKEEGNIIVNLNSVEKLGYPAPENAIGDDITFAGVRYEIVGVVDDFYQRGVQFALEPFSYNLDTALSGGNIALKLDSKEQLSKSIEEMEAVFTQTFPDAQFQSQIVEDVFMDQYENEQRFRTLFSIFTSIAVVIAILGVLGLASFILNQRIKEICVRKVLGAKSSSLFVILNKEYFLINVVSFALTIPISIYFMQNWLQEFENRIELGFLYFLLPFLITLIIVIISTLGHTMKVIRTNPATILKEED
ncbi:MAG: ABC transporter permease [Cyclobacteriaceae bacterium]